MTDPSVFVFLSRLKPFSMKNYKIFNFRLPLLFILGAMVLQSSKCPKDAPEPTPQIIVTVDFSIVQAANCPAPCQVCFTNASQNATSFQWDFGNGQTSTQTSPCVTYSERGTYTVRLTATSGTDTKVQTKQVIVATDNITRFKEVVPLSNQIARNVLVTPNGYVYVRYTNSAQSQFNIKRYGPYTAAGGLTNSVNQGYANDMGINDLVLDNDNSILLAGTKNNGAAVRKYTNMNLVFEGSYKYQNDATVSAQSLTPGVDGGYLLVGAKGPWNTGDKVGTYTVKVDRNGVKLNEGVFDITPSIGSSKTDVMKRVFRNPDIIDPYIGIGEWTDPLQGKKDIFISRINASGIVSSTTGSDILGVDNNQDDIVNDAVQFGGNKYAIVGKYNGNVSLMTFTHNNALVINRFDIVKNFPSLLYLTSICSLENTQGFPAQGFGVCGVTTDNKIFVAKLNATGDVVWQKTYGNAGFLTAPDIAYTFWDGGFVVVAEETCPDVSGCVARPVIMKMDRNGDIN